MVVLFQTTAKLNGNVITIDSRIRATTFEGRNKLKPWWAVVSAVYLFPTPDGLLIPIVKRNRNIGDFNNCWAILPAGGSDSLEELHYPCLALERETKEELIVTENGEKINISELAINLTTNKIIVRDKSDFKWHYNNFGELYLTDKELFFFRVYLIDKVFHNLVVKDGELYNGKPLNREVKLVTMKEIMSMKAETPTLEWAQRYFKRGEI